MGMMNDLYYAGPNSAAAGVNAFSDNFLKTYMGLTEQNQRQQQIDSQEKERLAQAALRDMQMQEIMRKQENAQKLKAHLASQFQNPGRTLTPQAMQLQGMMRDVPQGTMESGGAALNQAEQVSNQNTQVQGLLGDLKQQGMYETAKPISYDEMVQGIGQFLEPEQLIPLLGQKASMETLQDKLASRESVQDAKNEVMREKIQSFLTIADERNKNAIALKEMPSRSININLSNKGNGGADKTTDKAIARVNKYIQKASADRAKWYKSYETYRGTPKGDQAAQMLLEFDTELMKANNTLADLQNGTIDAGEVKWGKPQQEQTTQQKAKPLDKTVASQFLQQARGDKVKARQLAREAGYSF